MKVEKIRVGFLETNCYVISINDKCLIIDPGDEFNKIKNIVGDKEVLAVLITHYHFDHIGALEDTKKYYNVKVIDYRSDKDNMIGPFNFEIINTPGHKEDEVTFYFKKENIMFVGDFIFKGSIGRCDLDGGNYSEMLKSIDEIKKYNDNIVLYPGHGNKTTIKEEKENNPFLKGDNYE